MRRLTLLLLILASCSREPVAAPDGGLPPAEDSRVYSSPEEEAPVAAPDLRVQPDLRPPLPPGSCLPGERMWCDGLQYSSWGQVACDPATEKWRTKTTSSGQIVLDCQELASGERPNTFCACYHFYFNPACCEHQDCVVPPGSKGQICPPSHGGLCDYCNPQKPECTEPKARCVVTNSHETYCASFCSATEPCPPGYLCLVVKLAGGASTNQCVPSDYSCYY
jgi:hypothetical protein